MTYGEHFNLSLLFGIGGGRHKIKMQDLDPGVANGNGFFPEKDEETEYVNPAFLLSSAVDIRYNAKWFGFGIHGGYMWDLSNKKWRQEGNRIDGSQDTGMSGWMLQGFVSFFIKE